MYKTRMETVYISIIVLAFSNKLRIAKRTTKSNVESDSF